MCNEDHLFISGVRDLISAYNKLHCTTTSSVYKDVLPSQENFEPIHISERSVPIVEKSLTDDILSSSDEIFNLDFESDTGSHKTINVPEISPPKAKSTKKMWTLEEDKLLIRKLLEITGLQAGEISSKVVRDNGTALTQEFDRVLSSIVGRWRGYLLPIILSSLYGKLNLNVIPEVYKFLIEQKVKRIEEIDWTMLIKRWPFQTEESLKLMVRSAKNTGKYNQDEFLFHKLRRLLPLKRKSLSVRDQEFNTAIANAFSILKQNQSTSMESTYQVKNVSPEQNKRRLPLGSRSQNVSSLPNSNQDFIRNGNSTSTPIKKSKRSWTLEEEKNLIKSIFKVNKDFNASHIDETVAKNIFPRLQNKLNRPLSSIISHWFLILQPLILAHVYGKSDLPIIPSIFSNLISQKVKSLEDVNWKELHRLWPFQNERSLKAIVSRANDDSRVPANKVKLYEKLHVLRPYYLNKKTSSKKSQTNKEIINFYEKIMLEKRQNAFKNSYNLF